MRDNADLPPSPFAVPPKGADGRERWFLAMGPNLRSLVIGVCCAGATAMVCFASGLLYQTGLLSALSAGVGSAIGSLLLMPFMMFALARKPIVAGVVVIASAAFVWVVFARFFWGINQPGMAFWALLVYVFACAACRVALPDVWPRYLPHVCQMCNYDLRGAAPGRCPECGAAFQGSFPMPTSARSGRG